MSKKSDTNLPHPDYEKLTTIEEVEEAIQEHKNILVGKDRTEYQIKEEKKAFVAATNEQLRELAEEREHEINVLSALEQRKQQLSNAGGTVIPMPPPRVANN